MNQSPLPSQQPSNVPHKSAAPHCHLPPRTLVQLLKRFFTNPKPLREGKNTNEEALAREMNITVSELNAIIHSLTPLFHISSALSTKAETFVAAPSNVDVAQLEPPPSQPQYDNRLFYSQNDQLSPRNQNDQLSSPTQNDHPPNILSMVENSRLPHPVIATAFIHSKVSCSLSMPTCLPHIHIGTLSTYGRYLKTAGSGIGGTVKLYMRPDGSKFACKQFRERKSGESRVDYAHHLTKEYFIGTRGAVVGFNWIRRRSRSSQHHSNLRFGCRSWKMLRADGVLSNGSL